MVRALRCLLVCFFLFLVLAPVEAAADAIGADSFKMNVLDPPMMPNFLDITSTRFTFTFGACPTLPPGNTADGCLVADNGLGVDITGFTFFVPNQMGVSGLNALCGGGTPGQIFSTTDCPSTPGPGNNFVLNFDDGVITPGELFFITESGVDPSNFPPVTTTVSTASSVTPEPSSLLLLSTGLSGLGLLARRSRRRLGV